MTEHSDPDGFAFIAGRGSAQSGGQRQQVPLLEAIAILLDWRKRSSFRCTAEVLEGGQLLEFDVTAWPRVQSYSVRNADTGAVYGFDAHTGIMREVSDERPLLANQLSTEPVAARLAFPLSLGIWGRPGDSYRLTDAVEEGEAIMVAVEHQQNSAMVGSLTIDRNRRQAVRLDTPTLSIRYRDIQPVAEHI